MLVQRALPAPGCTQTAASRWLQLGGLAATGLATSAERMRVAAMSAASRRPKLIIGLPLSLVRCDPSSRVGLGPDRPNALNGAPERYCGDEERRSRLDSRVTPETAPSGSP